MIFSARQLQDLLKRQGSIVLPYRARLTPAAQDWVRHEKIVLAYSDVTIDVNGKLAPAAPGVKDQSSGPRFLWWSDGPDGVAKAGIGMAAREVKLESMAILEDGSRAISAVRTLNRAVNENTAAGGVLIARNAGPAVILANKARNLRAVVGTSMAAVEESIATMAANVLIVERDRLSLSQLKNLLVRFCRGDRKIDAVMEHELKELGTADERRLNVNASIKHFGLSA
ncbi:MAG: hypothetical protein H7144_04510 [Burkholderiales bacterium]|nr:hypothetical protein [Phycisphaerae bacterium]